MPRRPIRTILPLAAFAAGVLALPAAAPAAGPGGAFSAPAPRVTDVHCLRRCPAVRRAAPGTSVIAVRGTNLAGARIVRFLGGSGAGDDRSTTAATQDPQTVTAVVPEGARSGPVVVEADGGNASAPSGTRLEVGRSPGRGTIDGALGSTRVAAGGTTPATLRYLSRTGAPMRVDLLRLPARTVVTSWTPGAAPAGDVRTISWDGRSARGLATGGRYAFRVTELDASADVMTLPFTFVRDVFPIRGAHSYSMGAGRFGAGRGGRSHQGQDVFARCGTPLVAARGGVVQARTFQSLAGNYLVIDVDGTGQDDMYAHLRSPALVGPGQRVATGQAIGEVGDTGDAQGCHLHFEMWSAPGWYEGGRAFDPLPSLRKWDAQDRGRG